MLATWPPSVFGDAATRHNAAMITAADVAAARRRVGVRARRTPVLAADPDAFHAAALWLKCEFTQHTGSFKARGALNRVLAAAERGELTSAGIVTASGGNAGAAAAYAAAALGVSATVYVPQTAPRAKLAKLEALGAHVQLVGAEYAEAFDAAQAASRDHGALFCHAYDQVEVCAGQGVLALELLEQLEGRVDTVVAAVGGGGLVAGMTAAIGRRTRVVGVEPRTAAALHTALQHGGPVDVTVSGIAADSLGARRAGELAYQTAVEHDVVSVLVDDADIIHARNELWKDRRLAVEHGAAAAFAALLSGAYRPEADERVAVVLCGANTDPSDLAT